MDKKIKTEVYSRVSGYYRPVLQWNKGKQSEFSERKTLQLPEIARELPEKNIYL